VVHGIELDNCWVVPHNVYLLTKYNAHINVEVYNNIRAVKYLFKYVYKGHDHAIIEISRQSDNATEGNVVDIDQIKKYLDCRYVSASEAAWRIFKFDMHERFPTANHELQLKVGVPILLLRNLNQSIRLCNGTRLIVKRLGQRVIETEIITGNNVGKCVFIPRIIMSPTGIDWPFVLRRRQFAVQVAFAITINKNQGHTFDNVGVYLPSPVYSHGQLYVAISRVTSSANIKIFNGQGPDGYMRNVEYKEV